MEDTRDAGRYIAEGYSFHTEEDAALAENEHRKVEYLNARLDYNDPENILRIYKKAIDERIFKSPVGLFFLKSLQRYLINQPGIDSDEVKPIPLYITFENEFREKSSPARNRVKPAPPEPEKKSPALRISVVLNIGLVAALIAMFVIALNANQPNILNYERVLTDRYATWDQELTEREQAVRAQERLLEQELNSN